MAADLGDLYARLKLDTTSLDAAVAKTHGLGSAIGTAFIAAGVAATAAGVGIAAVSVKMAADFQQATVQLVTGAGESVKNLALIRQGILELAPAVGTSPAELAKALYLIESAGFHGAAGLAVLKASAEGAKVGLADQATVADAVTSALNAYGLGGDRAISVTNDLVATVAAGKLHMQDLASAIGAVLAPAAALGVKLPEVSGAIATMTSQGTDASRATQSLRFLIAALTGPTAAATKEMKGLGIGMQEIPGITASMAAEMKNLGLKTTDVAYTLSHQGLQAALEQITEAIGKKFPKGSAEYNAALRDAVGGTRGFTAALELTGSHAATFTENVKGIAAAAGQSGTAVQGWALIQQDFTQKLDQAKASLDVLLITIGTALLPILGQVVDWFSKVIGSLVGATGATGPLQTAVHDVTDTLKAMGEWIGAHVVPALQSMATWFKDHVLPVLADLASWVRDKVLPELGKLADTFNRNVLPAIQGVATWLVDHLIKPLIDLAKIVIPPLLQVLDWLGQHINAVLAVLIPVVAGFVAWKVVLAGVGIWNAMNAAVSGLAFTMKALWGAEDGAAGAAVALGVAAKGGFGAALVALGPLSGAALALYGTISGIVNQLEKLTGHGVPGGTVAPGTNPITGQGGIFNLLGHQHGGFIPPGQWGITGEAGPEAVYGGQTGATVIPNAAGGITQNLHITLNGGDEALVQRVQQVVTRSLNDVLLAARS